LRSLKHKDRYLNFGTQKIGISIKLSGGFDYGQRLRYHIHTGKKTHRKDKKKTNKPDVPEKNSVKFFVKFFFYTVKLRSLTVSVWVHHTFLSKFLFLSYSH
jgi:hypothetical protein